MAFQGLDYIQGQVYCPLAGFALGRVEIAPVDPFLNYDTAGLPDPGWTIS